MISLRTMSNKKLSTKENSELIEAFNLFDADKDNRINADEILALIKALGGQVELVYQRLSWRSNLIVSYSRFYLCSLSLYKMFKL